MAKSIQYKAAEVYLQHCVRRLSEANFPEYDHKLITQEKRERVDAAIRAMYEDYQEAWAYFYLCKEKHDDG